MSAINYAVINPRGEVESKHTYLDRARARAFALAREHGERRIIIKALRMSGDQVAPGIPPGISGWTKVEDIEP